MLELLYATGMRVSEMLHLQIFDVNLQFGYVVCNENGKERIIPYQSDVDYLREYVESWGVPFVLFETEFDATTDTRKSPCFLCSWNRRKALFTVAKEQGCNKIALG